MGSIMKNKQFTSSIDHRQRHANFPQNVRQQIHKPIFSGSHITEMFDKSSNDHQNKTINVIFAFIKRKIHDKIHRSNSGSN